MKPQQWNLSNKISIFYPSPPSRLKLRQSNRSLRYMKLLIPCLNQNQNWCMTSFQLILYHVQLEPVKLKTQMITLLVDIVYIEGSKFFTLWMSQTHQCKNDVVMSNLVNLLPYSSVPDKVPHSYKFWKFSPSPFDSVYPFWKFQFRNRKIFKERLMVFD